MARRHRYDRPSRGSPFDRDRAGRDARAPATARPTTTISSRPGDSPRERVPPRRRGRAGAPRGGAPSGGFLAGEFAARPRRVRLHLPAGCDELDDRSGRPVHAEGLPVLLRPRLIRCYRGPVRGSLLLISRGEALS